MRDLPARSKSLLLSLALVTQCFACASSNPTPVEVPELASSSKAVRKVPAGSVEREEVQRTVDAGLGAFLQRLTVEPVVEGEKFIGFRLTQLQNGLVREGVNVQVGDIVTHVNGRSLEAESDAFEVFQSLETAKEIRLSLLRNGQPQEVVVPIIGEPLGAQAREGDAGAAG